MMTASSNLSFDQDRTRQVHLIGQVMASILNPETFNKQMAETIQDGFGFYHVGIYLIDDSGQWAVINDAAGAAAQAMIQAGYRLALDEQSPVGWAGYTQQARLTSPLNHPWLPESRSELVLPLLGGRHVIGLLDIHSTVENAFSPEDVSTLQTLAGHLALAMDKLNDLQSSLHEAHLMLDISRRFSGTVSLKDVCTILTKGFIAAGAERCTLHICDEPGLDNLPKRSEIVSVSDVEPSLIGKGMGDSFRLADYPTVEHLVYTQETLAINNIATAERLNSAEQALLQKFGAQSIVITPLVSRYHVIGILFVEYRRPHNFNERELALYRTLCNQGTTAIEHARQVQQTELALAETQTLYRAGRVLAGAANLQEVLQEALIEFVYSLGLDQGGVTLITFDRKFGQLMAYVQEGQLQDVQQLKFRLVDNDAYQQILLSGQPFVSIDAPNDPRLKGFQSFNQAGMAKSLLEAPIIIYGETIGWIGADSVKEHRRFTQQEIDMARAMADQIAVTIQNRRLLEQTARRAEQLQAVAKVGDSVSRMLDLGEILNSTVDLIRDRFHFYHVSIFLVDEAREWAVVHASTGEVGRIMVARPHRLQVGSNSIVGFVTAQGQPRIALDVGEDAVHFKNPLLPDTRSEMGLPLISRGAVIGALDVQSVEVNAFSDEDIETLQIMADQLATAIENARLFEQTQHSQKFMKSIIDQIPDPIFIKDKNHKWIVANQAFAQGLLGRSEEEVIGSTDHDYFPKKQAQWFWAQDNKMFATGQTQETEEPFSTVNGQTRILYTRKIPLMDSDGQPEYLIGIINDITERKQAEETLKAAFERTQSLYRISDALATPTDERTTAEAVLGEYLRLLKLKQGALLFLDQADHYYEAQALFANGQSVQPNLVLTGDEDPLMQYLIKETAPLVIENTETHPLTQNRLDYLGGAKAILAVPLVMRDKVAGALLATSVEARWVFSESDIEIGAAVADQLTIWLENRRLLAEAQHRSNLLQTAAEVSRASSSILDVNELINTSVNHIRDQFNFYYVGLFLIDEAREWAVLQAGTGEAGRMQLERHHRLKIGGESMIGWCIQNRQARIALDVGQEAVRFQNPYLPETHSEMALPLISRDQVIGALTVQSMERSAFSTEDITLLQTMADQLANAIENARLFAQTQKALSETETLYQITQELLSAHDEESVYRLAVEAIAQTTVDSAAIYMYLESRGDELSGQMLEQKAVWTAGNHSVVSTGARFSTADLIIEQIIPQHGTLVIEDTTNNDPRLTDQLRRELTLAGIKSLVALSLSTYQNRLGFLLITCQKERVFTPQQLRFYNTITQQMIIALENLRLLNVSQRRARREEIIREISSKIRGATTVEDILKTAVGELSQVLGASRGGIALNVNLGQSQAEKAVNELNPRAKPTPKNLKDGQNGQ